MTGCWPGDCLREQPSILHPQRPRCQAPYSWLVQGKAGCPGAPAKGIDESLAFEKRIQDFGGEKPGLCVNRWRRGGPQSSALAGDQAEDACIGGQAGARVCIYLFGLAEAAG